MTIDDDCVDAGQGEPNKCLGPFSLQDSCNMGVFYEFDELLNQMRDDT
jgi:hypothetical protein